MANLEFGTPSNPEEAQHLGQLLSQCFNAPVSEWSLYSKRLGLENFRAVRTGGQVVGGLCIHHMGQWFGGKSVPMAGIASVGIAPEHRGTGAAAALMTNTLKELHTQGIPISTLYAATSVLYRKVGYDQGGNYCRLAVPISRIQLSGTASLKEVRTLPIHSVEPADHSVFHELYRQQAIANNGNLDRGRTIWEQVVDPQGAAIFAYLIGSAQHPEGYVIFTHKPGTKGYHLQIRDMVALTPAAVRRLWIFFADHRSQAEDIIWYGSTGDPLLSLLAEQTYQIVSLERWFLRVVDVPKALMLRGYPLGVTTQLHLEIQDSLLPDNNGQFILTVSEGRGEVTKGGRGEFRLDVRGLAPLFTGLLTPHQLRRIGQVEATTEALSAATQIFAGSEPWMPDFF